MTDDLAEAKRHLRNVLRNRNAGWSETARQENDAAQAFLDAEGQTVELELTCDFQNAFPDGTRDMSNYDEIETALDLADAPVMDGGRWLKLPERITAFAAELTRLKAAQDFQQRVDPWLIACFGEEIARDRMERNHRFFEEATELVQANGMTASEAHQLVDYTYGRPVGEASQEVGGVMVTLAALCLASGLDMHAAAETELARIWTKVEKIRAKQAAKPKHSPLPEHVPASSQPEHDRTVRLAALEEVAAHFRKLAGLPDWNGDGAPESWNVAEMEVRALKDQTGGEGGI